MSVNADRMPSNIIFDLRLWWCSGPSRIAGPGSDHLFVRCLATSGTLTQPLSSVTSANSCLLLIFDQSPSHVRGLREAVAAIPQRRRDHPRWGPKRASPGRREALRQLCEKSKRPYRRIAAGANSCDLFVGVVDAADRT